MKDKKVLPERMVVKEGLLVMRQNERKQINDA